MSERLRFKLPLSELPHGSGVTPKVTPPGPWLRADCGGCLRTIAAGGRGSQQLHEWTFADDYGRVWIWPGAESNHRHADFQSAALPTELPGRGSGGGGAGPAAKRRVLDPNLALSRKQAKNPHPDPLPQAGVGEECPHPNPLSHTGEGQETTSIARFDVAGVPRYSDVPIPRR